MKKFYSHQLRITLTGISCFNENSTPDDEQLREFIHGMDSATWRDEITTGAFEVAVSYSGECDEDGELLVEEAKANNEKPAIDECVAGIMKDLSAETVFQTYQDFERRDPSRVKDLERNAEGSILERLQDIVGQIIYDKLWKMLHSVLSEQAVEEKFLTMKPQG